MSSYHRMRDIIREMGMTPAEVVGEYHDEQKTLQSILEVGRNEDYEDYIYRAVTSIIGAPQIGRIFNVQAKPTLWSGIGKTAVEHFGISPTTAAQEIFNVFYEVGYEEEKVSLVELIHKIELTTGY